MAFGNKKTPPPPKRPAAPPSTAEMIARYQSFAQSELQRANKAGRLEAQAVHANRSIAASNLALLMVMQSNATTAGPVDSSAEMAARIEAIDVHSAEIDAQLAALDAPADGDDTAQSG